MPNPRPVTNRSRPYLVFVSHATPDKWVATVLCEKIESIPGVTTFRDDKDIRSGDEIAQVLHGQLRRADELVVLMTPVSVTRPWVLFELGAAWGQRKRISPIRYQVAPDQMPGPLPVLKAVELNDFDSYLSDLAGRVAKRGGK